MMGMLPVVAPVHPGGSLYSVKIHPAKLAGQAGVSVLYVLC
jgi:hypothetical protein